MNLNELKTLCGLYGTSGREHAVRSYILEELRKLELPQDAVRVDRLGNVLVHKKGAADAKHRVMFSAHMDEVALMVTHINSDGIDTLKRLWPKWYDLIMSYENNGVTYGEALKKAIDKAHGNDSSI